MAERTASEVADELEKIAGTPLKAQMLGEGKFTTAVEQPVFAFPSVLIAAADMLRQQWRPIETAPKDGTWILGWAAVGEEPEWSGAEVVRFNTRGRTLTRPAGWHDSRRLPYTPTHWQPLPAAPQEPR